MLGRRDGVNRKKISILPAAIKTRFILISAVQITGKTPPRWEWKNSGAK
jgi:hypothetical protein